MARGMKWFYWLGVVVLSALALWVPRAESMPPVVVAAVAGVAGIVASEPAQAAAVAPAAKPTAGQQADKVLSRAMNGIQAAGARMAGALWTEGITLFWLVWILMFGWTIYKNYHQSDDLVGSLALFGATSTFIWLVMMLYMPPRGGVDTFGGSPVYMAQIFTSGFEDYAKKIAGSSGISGMGVNWNSMQAVGAKMFWNSIVDLVNFARGTQHPDPTGVWETLVAILGAFGRAPLIILSLIAAAFIGLAMVVYLFVILMADILVAIGLTLGPIMIPFYLMPVLSFLFDSWLRFMITAGFFKLVATAMLGLTSALINELSLTSTAIGKQSGQIAALGADYLTIFLAIVIAFLTFLMMWQVPSIAAALTGGSAGGDLGKAARSMMTASDKLNAVLGKAAK